MSEYFKKTFSVLSTQVLILPLTIASSIIVARTLGPDGKGILAIIVLIATTLKLLGGVGTEFANVYYVSKKRHMIHNILFNNILVWLLSTITLGLLFIILKNILLKILLPNFEQYMLIFALIIFPFLLWFGFSLTFFQGLESFKEFNLLKISEPVIKLVSVAILLLVIKMSIKGGAIAILLSYLIPALCSIIMLRKHIKQKPGFNKDLLGTSIKYGLKGQVGIFFQFFNYRLDLFLVNYFLDVKQVGLYSLSVVIAELLWYVPNSIALTLFPKVSTKGKQSANEFTRRISRYSTAIMLILALALGAGARFIITLLYGIRFIGSVLPLQILLPGVITFGIAKILTSYMHGRGKPQYGSIVTICSLILTIAFDVLLIPRMGIIGAALATTIAYSFSLILTLLFFMKVSGLKLKEFLMPDFNCIMLFLAKIQGKRRDE